MCPLQSLFYYLVRLQWAFLCWTTIVYVVVQKGELLRMYPQPVQMKAVQDNKPCHLPRRNVYPWCFSARNADERIASKLRTYCHLTVDTINTLDMKNSRHCLHDICLALLNHRSAPERKSPYLRGWPWVTSPRWIRSNNLFRCGCIIVSRLLVDFKI